MRKVPEHDSSFRDSDNHKAPEYGPFSWDTDNHKT